MRKIAVVLTVVSILVFSQHIFTPLGMNFLEMGWRYFGYNPASLGAIGSSGFVINFEYATDSKSKEFSNIRIGYQSVERSNGLNGELTIDRSSGIGGVNYALDYTIAGVNGNYFWGFNSKIYRTEIAGEDADWGLKVGFGMIGNLGTLKGAVALKDITILSTDISKIATGQFGAAMGWINDKFAIHMGMMLTNFKFYEAYAGAALGVSPAFFSLSVGYATDFQKNAYHVGLGVAWQGKGALVAANFDLVPQPVNFSIERAYSLPYRFSIAFKLPVVEEEE